MAGVFKHMWIDGLFVYDKKSGIDWKWRAIDRAKSGTKRSIVVDGKGVPHGIAVNAANRHDIKMTRATLQSIVVHRPKPSIKSRQYMCMDRGYDFPEVYELLLDMLIQFILS